MLKERAIKNAEWWMNHSHVLLKGILTLDDNATVANAAEGHRGDTARLKIQHMVTQGVVAVMLPPDGEKYECKLPDEAGNLLDADALYILEQIEAISKPMSAEEQKAFLARANAHSKAS